MAFLADEDYMQRCLYLARQSAGAVAPNPMVGSVIVKDGKIIGEGRHEAFGQAHAEVNAIRQVAHPELLLAATLYVNLEPCSHYGKTPPCADLIIKHRIPKVVIGMKDPHEKVAGMGIQKLRDAGIEVKVGVLEAACQQLNKAFIRFHQKQRPHVFLKWAQTQDGFLARKNKNSKWISSLLSRIYVHQLRNATAAILVGRETALTDDPGLDTRFWPGSHPLPVVLDQQLTLPSSLKVFQALETATWVVNEWAEGYISKDEIKKTKERSLKTLVKTQLKPIEKGDKKTSAGRIYFVKSARDLDELMRQCYTSDINQLMVEGGSRTLASFTEKGLWDEAFVFENPKLQFGTGIEAPSLLHLPIDQEIRIGEDKLKIIKNH